MDGALGNGDGYVDDDYVDDGDVDAGGVHDGNADDGDDGDADGGDVDDGGVGPGWGQREGARSGVEYTELATNTLYTQYSALQYSDCNVV